MENSQEKNENSKAENKSEANNNAKNEEKTWWENIAKDNPQFGTVIKALSNPLLSAGSIAGLIYTVNVSKTAKQAAEDAKKENEKVVEEINQELYVKYATKYKQEKLDLMKELGKVNSDCSNLENEAEFATEIAENISNLWHSAEYKEKQRLQYYLFPSGIYYNRKKDTVRTDEYNPLFLWMCRQMQDAGNKKSGIPELGLSYAALVAPPGIEPGSKV